MLKSIVSKFSPAETLARLTAEWEAAHVALDAAQRAWAEALASAAEVSGDDGAAEKVAEATEMTLRGAQRRMDKADAAMSGFRARQVRQAAKDAEAARVERWDRVEELDEARKRAAARFAKSSAAYAADRRAFHDATTALMDELPSCPDPDAALLQRDPLEIMERQELARLGVPWAIATPWGRDSIPEFTARFENVSDVIRVWRAADLARTQR